MTFSLSRNDQSILHKNVTRSSTTPGCGGIFSEKKTYLVKNKMLSSFCVEMVVISRVKKSEKEFAN